MTNVQNFFRPKKFEVTISPLANSIQVEVANVEAKNYRFDCMDIPMTDFEDYSRKMGYLDSYYAIYEIMDSEGALPSIEFKEWLVNQDDFQLMMMVLNFLYDKKVVPC